MKMLNFRVGCAALALSFVAAAMTSAAGEDKKTIADKVYSAAQAERGEARFKTSCTACHSPNSFSGGAFAEKWSGQTLSEVFDFISNAMPENDPGSLKREDYVNVIAFMLKINNLPTGDADLPTDSAGLKNIQIDPK
ncbi:MAG: cytochrome c [Vicinamibacterales bacterium]